jgi:prephenate dehydrogenase
MQIKTLGIIGYGSFGSFTHELARQYIPEVQTRVYSSRFPADGQTFFALEETCKSDVLVLAVPISAFEEQLDKVLQYINQNTIVVDIATVKMHTTNILQKHKDTLHFVAMHPMFGPYSYLKKGRKLDGLRVVLTGYTIPTEEYDALKALFAKVGLVVLEASSEEHDQTLAETLFLTHYIAQMVTKAGYKRTEIDTVSFGFLMDAIESVQNDTELFQDVYIYNPYCKKVVETLEKAEHEVSLLLSERRD